MKEQKYTITESANIFLLDATPERPAHNASAIQYADHTL